MPDGPTKPDGPTGLDGAVSSAAAGESWPTPTGSANGPPVAKRAGTPASQTYTFRPTTITLPSGAVAPVDPAGVDNGGVLEVPVDPARLGWWTGGAMAGEPYGSVVLAGHVDSATQGLGVLVELLDARVGDEVTVGDEVASRRYRVESVDEIPKARLAAEFDAFRQDVDHRLVLITCGGEFDAATRSYADNVVAVAVAVD